MDDDDRGAGPPTTDAPPWSAPARVEPPFVDAQRNSLDAWLDYHRATLLMKCAGLNADQLALRSCAPSSLSLLGLVRHMAEVERNWFRRVVDGQDAPPMFYSDSSPDGDFDDLEPARAGEDLAAFRTEVDAAREIAARHDLDDVGRHHRIGDVDLRWVMVHMIEEYARHNGHADLLRERIDGVTGD